MPIYVDVISRLDERSAQVTSDRLADLSTAGRTGAQNFLSGLTSGLSSGSGQVSSALSGITSAAGSMGTGVAAAGAVAAAGVAAIGAAAVAAGQELYGIGERFDGIADSISIRTGKMGEDLDGLVASVRNVATQTASSFEDIASIGAQVSQTFDVAGRPLEELTNQIANFNRMTGESLNIRQFGMTLRGFGEDSSQAGERLDELFVAFQDTGISVDELVNTMGSMGPAARSLGLDFDETAALILNFQRAGIDADKSVAGLNRAATTFADAGINMQTGLRDTITQIRGFIDAGNDAAAVDLAGKVFGTRSAQLFVDAIRNGKVNVDSLNDTLDTTGRSISDMDKATSDWAETWDKLKNRALAALEPIGTKIFELLNQMGQLLLQEQPELPPSAPGQPLQGSGVYADEPPTFGPPLPGSVVVPDQSGLPPALQTPTTGPGLVDPRIQAPIPNTTLPLGPERTPPPQQDVYGAVSDDAAGGSSGPKLPAPPVVPYDTSLPAGIPGVARDSQIYSAESSFLDARHDLAEKQARLNQLEASNVATADDIQKARNDVVTADRALQQSQMRLSDAWQSQYDSLTKANDRATKQLQDSASALGEVGASLDKDFGISKGLAGIAENITKFVANLAFAPVVGALRGVQAGVGFDPGSGGKGLFGMFGPDSTQRATSSPGGYGPGYGGQSYTAGYAGDAALLANVPAGRYTQTEGADLTQGLADCSSSVEDLVNILDGRPTAGRSMSTHNADAWLTSRGFVPGMGGPGDFRVGFNEGHMQATLPGGTPFNWGSDSAAANRGIGGTGAFDPAFTSHYYRPMGAGPSAFMPTGGYTPSVSAPSAPLSTGWGSPGIPSTIIPGAGGQGPVLGANPAGPGLGASATAGPAAFSGMTGQAYPNPVGGSGYGGLSGLPMAAIQTGISAAAAAGAPFGGQAAGAAAQMGIELANRAAAFAGQAAGIGVSGLLETLTLSGDSPMANIGNSWLGRIASGFAGAAPAIANTAGQLAPPLNGDQAKQGAQKGVNAARGGTTVNNSVTVNNNNATENQTGKIAAEHLGARYSVGMR